MFGFMEEISAMLADSPSLISFSYSCFFSQLEDVEERTLCLFDELLNEESKLANLNP